MALVGRVAVIVSPGAKRTDVVGRHGDAWKLRVAARPVGGRANRAVTEHLAAALGVPREAVEVVAGAGARRKIVAVAGVDGAELDRRLAAAAEVPRA